MDTDAVVTLTWGWQMAPGDDLNPETRTCPTPPPLLFPDSLPPSCEPGESPLHVGQSARPPGSWTVNLGPV